ncbi:MAG: protein phosphatase 2C domain-containing protein [Pseudomonadota bacterium]
MSYKIEAGTGQHIGDRKEQQDRIGLFGAPRAPGYMMAVLADGMGGAHGGSIAADQAIRTAHQIFDNFSPLTSAVETMLHEIASEVHTVIQLMTLATEMRPGSTLVVLVITPEKTAIWGHIGDSRLYRFSGPNLVERTVDQTSTDGAANKVVNMLGSAHVAPKMTLARHVGLRAGDAFMLCSDGLWQHCSDGEAGAAIAVNSPRDAAQMLIHRARERTTDKNGDNCTLGIVKLVATSAPAPQYRVDKLNSAV